MPRRKKEEWQDTSEEVSTKRKTVPATGNVAKENSFYRLFLKELRDIYNAENQMIEVFPKLIKSCFSNELKEALQEHYKETKQQVVRLDRVFSVLNESPQKVTCQAMVGLIEEVQKVLQEEPNSVIRDAAIIPAAQRIEHYEIACYGTAKTFAKLLDYENIAELLNETLQEEGKADKTLTSIAEGGFFSSGINRQAMEQIVSK